MSYKIDEGRLGCLIEIYAEFLEKNSNYIIDRNNNLEYFKSILEKIKKNELTNDDLKEIFSKKRLYSLPPYFKSPVRDKWLSNVIEQVEFFNKKNQRLDKNKINEISRSLEDNKSYFALTTELLCAFYPDQYCIKNNKVEEMIKKLKDLDVLLVEENKFYEDYDKLIEFEGVILKYMKNNEKLKNVYQQVIGRTNVNYYDVDMFLYWIIDDKYEEKNKTEILREQIEKCLERISEEERSMKTLANYFKYKGFYFDQDLITAFYAALKTKGFVILSGLTGTGKTKLAQLFAELLCPNCNPQDKQNTQIPQASSENQNQNRKCTHLFLSVRPDWRDSKALLGYYNPITKEYERTPLLDFILDTINNYRTEKDNPVPFFIILDEMNLSHVEYYFADFLSVLESGRDENYWTKETIKLHNIDKKESNDKKEDIGKNAEKEDISKNKETIPIPKEIKLPPNLYIIGSVNIDETTYMFSPKVLDRAFTIEFREVNLDKYLASIQNEQINISKDDKFKKLLEQLRDELLKDLRNNGKFCTVVADKDEIKSAFNELDPAVIAELNQLNQILQSFDLHFGYRVLDEIALFIKYAMKAPNEVGQLSPEKALDFAVLMKVLPKFHGPRQKLEKPLWLVLKWCFGIDVKFENKTFDDLIKEIWEKLSPHDQRPSIEGFTRVIQELKFKLNNKSENVHKKDSPGSQPIEENQNKTTEQTQEPTSESNQTEQTNKDEKKTIIDNIKYPRTAIKVLTMLRQLYETGFTSFA
jgi:energy-coupling factor transporter ATP-binding protein EcfA2